MLCVQTRDGKNGNWGCVREELRHLRKDVFRLGFEKDCDQIEKRAEEAWRQLTEDERERRKVMPGEIRGWLRSARMQWNNPEKE